MLTESLNLQHKELLYQRLRRINPVLSEYSFANLYLFRKNHEYEVMNGPNIFIQGKTYDSRTYIMPTVAANGLDFHDIRDRLREVDFLFPVPESWLNRFSPEEFEVSYNDGDHDYVYSVEKMSTYRGRKLHNKKNLLTQFMGLYEHQALPLTNDRLEQARFVLHEWQKTSKMKPEDTDYEACLEGLERYEELILCGGIYYADCEPAGFVIGEELNDDTFVLHFAKARTKFKGVYQYMFNNFAKVLPPKYKYLNLGQDLNKENLRVFKSSYVPEFLLKKARVRLKK